MEENKHNAVSGSLDRESRLRLRGTRERAGKHPSELAGFLDGSTSAYHDLENCDGELLYNVDIGSLCGICGFLQVSPRSLFETNSSARIISMKALSERMQAHLNMDGITLFSDKVNYEMADALTNPSTIWDWNIECLRNVCAELGINWVEALPESRPFRPLGCRARG